MTRVSTTEQQGVSGDGHHAGGRFRLEPQRRQVAVPQLVVALVVIAVSALIAVVAFSKASARTPVLALAADVERGSVVAASDLRVMFVASDDPLTTVPSDAAAGLVGLVVVADLPAGSLVFPGLFVDRQVVAAGEGVVGLALAPGEYPTSQLGLGDLVDVIYTDGAAGVLVASAEVFDVTELGTQGSRFVSLRMPVGEAAAVAQAAGSGGLRLVLVGDGAGAGG
jgi:hypothetical protein